MRLFLLLFVFSFYSWSADDAEFNPIAEKIKAKVLKDINGEEHLVGFCNVYIYMKYKGKTAYVSRVKTSGDYKLCKASKKAIKLNKPFRYTNTEKILRIHVSK